MEYSSYLGERNPSGTANIFIPTDVDRERFIQRCFNTGTVSIILQDGGIINNVLCDLNSFNQIQFPKDSKELGSLVAWIIQSYSRVPIIVGVLNRSDQTLDIKENQASLSKSTNNGKVDFIADSNSPVAIINSSSLTEQGGDIYIQSQNGSLTSKINISSSGEINIISQNTNFKISDEFNITIHNPEINSNKTTIKYIKDEGFTYEDEFNNKIEIIDGKINIDSENINIGGDAAQQPLILGTNLVNLLDQILTLLGSTTAPTVFGASPLATSPAFVQLKSQLEALKSKKHKIE